jgi:hypothetical protein
MASQVRPGSTQPVGIRDLTIRTPVRESTSLFHQGPRALCRDRRPNVWLQSFPVIQKREEGAWQQGASMYDAQVLGGTVRAQAVEWAAKKGVLPLRGAVSRCVTRHARSGGCGCRLCRRARERESGGLPVLKGHTACGVGLQHTSCRPLRVRHYATTCETLRNGATKRDGARGGSVGGGFGVR